MTALGAGATGDDRDLRGVVLAGGRSRRFGDRDKALARFDGRTLVSRAVDAVAPLNVDPPFVAVGTASRRALLGSGIDRPVEYVFDPPETKGPVGGILAAARVTETDRLAVVGCDMPLATTEAIRWLAGQSADADAIVPVDEGGALQPVFAVYRHDRVNHRSREPADECGVVRPPRRARRTPGPCRVCARRAQSQSGAHEREHSCGPRATPRAKRFERVTPMRASTRGRRFVGE